MTNYSAYSDEELVNEIKADNMFAFDVLYKRYWKRVYKFGFSILKLQDDAESLVQEVFLNLWDSRHKVEKGSSVKSYLFSVTYNAAISIIRKKTRETEFYEYLQSIQKLEDNSVSKELEFNELKNELDKIINELPWRQKEVYHLHKDEGLKYFEIAEKLNISVNTVENLMSNALKTIRNRLGRFSLAGMIFSSLFT